MPQRQGDEFQGSPGRVLLKVSAYPLGPFRAAGQAESVPAVAADEADFLIVGTLLHAHGRSAVAERIEASR